MSWAAEFISKCKTIALVCFCIPDNNNNTESDSSDYTTIDDHPVIPKASGSHILAYLGPDMANHKEYYDSSEELKRRVDALKENHVQMDNLQLYSYTQRTLITPTIMNTQNNLYHSDHQTDNQVERSDVVYPIDKIFATETEDEQNMRQLHVIKTLLGDDNFTSRLKKYDQGHLVHYIAKRLQENNYDDQFVNRCSWFLHMLELTDDRSLEYYIDRFTAAIVE